MASEVVSIPSPEVEPELSSSPSVAESPDLQSELPSFSPSTSETPNVQPEQALTPSATEKGATQELSPPFITRPNIPFSKRMTAPLFEPEEPLIKRLADVARPKKEQPIAGWVGIQRMKEPLVEVPPECMLYEVDHFKFQLGKMPKHRDFPQVIPENSWEPPVGAQEPEKSPTDPAGSDELEKSPAREKDALKAKAAPKKVVTKQKLPLATGPRPTTGAKITAGLVKAVEELAISELNEVRELAEDQNRVNPELPPPKNFKKGQNAKGKASPIESPKGKDDNKKVPATASSSPSTPKRKPSLTTPQTPQRK